MAKDNRFSGWTIDASGMKPIELDDDDSYAESDHKIASVVDKHKTSRAVEEQDAASLWAEYTSIPWKFWKNWGCLDRWPNIVFTWKEVELSRVKKLRRLDSKTQKGKCTWEEKPSFAVLWPSPEDGEHKEIWLVEGESDCGTLRFLGLDAYTLGTATEPISLVTIQLLREIGVQKINVLFDADAAGQKGSRKLAEELANQGFEARLLNLLAVRRQYEKDVSDILRFRGQLALRNSIDALVNTAESVEDIRMDVVLQGDEDTEWIWDRVLPTGAVALLTGPPKTLKTFLLYFMMKAAHAGAPVLGRDFRKSKILYYSEMPTAFDKSRKDRILGELPDREHLFIRHEFAAAFVGKSWLERVTVLENDVRRYGIDLLILDTASAWFMLAGDEENSATAIRAAFSPLRRITDKYNCTCLVIHHTNRSGAGPRGSGAFEAIPDILLSQSINGDEQIELDILGRVNGMRGRIAWAWPMDAAEPVVYSDTDTNELAKSLQNKEDIVLEALKDVGPCTVKKLVEVTDLPIRVVRRALQRLAQNGFVVRTDDEGSGEHLWHKFGFSVEEL